MTVLSQRIIIRYILFCNMEVSAIKNAIYHNQDVTRMYVGDILIFPIEKPNEGITGYLRGKFTDNSKSSDWWYYDFSKFKKIDITEFVNPETKEFKVDLGNPTTLRNLFQENTALEKIYEVPVNSTMTELYGIFDGCSSLNEIQGLENWKTENVTRMSRIFGGCSALTEIKGLENWNTSNVSSIVQLFHRCNQLQNIDLSGWNTERVTEISLMFGNCDSIKTIDLRNWNTEKVTDMKMLFNYCSSLQTLIWDFNIAENTVGTTGALDLMFYDTNYYPNFTTIQTTGGFKICESINFRYCYSLTNESVMVIINALEDRSSKTNKTLTLHSTQYDELTPEQLAIATAKNWTVVRNNL